MKILLSCLLFLLITAIFSYSALQQSNAKAKDITTINKPKNVKQKTNYDKPQKTENVDIKKDKKRQTTLTSAVNTPQNTPQSSTTNTNASVNDQKAIGGSTNNTETTNISSQPYQAIDYNIPPSPPAQQQSPPQPPSPPQTSETDRAAAAQAAKDAWATQSNQTSTTPANNVTVVNSSSNNVNPANGAYSTNQVITSPGNSASVNTAGEVRIITGPSN